VQAGFDLKTKEHPRGLYTPEELYQILSDIYSYIFLEVEASTITALRAKVSAHVKTLLGHIKGHLDTGTINRDYIASIFSRPGKNKPKHHEFVEHLSDTGLPHDMLANAILVLMVSSTVELSLALSNMVNLYLTSEHQSVLGSAVKTSNRIASEIINELQSVPDSEGINELQSDSAYFAFKALVYEALRLDPPLQGVYRTATKYCAIGSTQVKAGDRVFLNVADANLDGVAFLSPNTVNTNRGSWSILHGDRTFSYLGKS